MCDRGLGRALGIGFIAFGLGILLTYLLRGILLTALGATAIGVLGVMLIKER